MVSTKLTPNELVNYICKRYYTGEVNPGYNSETDTCEYFLPSNGNGIPSMCAIGCIIPNDVLNIVTGYKGCVRSLCQNSTNVQSALFESLDASKFKTKTFQSGTDAVLSFLGLLQGSHDNFFCQEYTDSIPIGKQVAHHIWIEMHRLIPELVKGHFLPEQE